MKERPILFSAPMVRAILSGSKSQTRRIVRWPTWAQPHPEVFARDLRDGQEVWYVPGGGQPSKVMRCPYGQPRDRLWVREGFRLVRTVPGGVDGDTLPPSKFLDSTRRYEADREESYPDARMRVFGKRRSPIHMPRWASRITLEVTGVRVERLQDISHIDAVAEGCSTGSWTIAEGPRPEAPFGSNAVKRYRLLWESINGPGSWDVNPWTWVVEFRRLP
ncbi:MAG: hypothetical protein ACK52V_04615 [Betaproteobacteria bacterium]